MAPTSRPYTDTHSNHQRALRAKTHNTYSPQRKLNPTPHPSIPSESRQASMHRRSAHRPDDRRRRLGINPHADRVPARRLHSVLSRGQSVARPHVVCSRFYRARGPESLMLRAANLQIGSSDRELQDLVCPRTPLINRAQCVLSLSISPSHSQARLSACVDFGTVLRKVTNARADGFVHDLSVPLIWESRAFRFCEIARCYEPWLIRWAFNDFSTPCRAL